MLKKNFLCFTFLSTLLCMTNVSALQSTSDMPAQAGIQQPQIIVAPECLVQQLTEKPKILANLKDFSLIEINKSAMQQLIEIKNNRSSLCGGFINVTTEWKKSLAKNNFKDSTSQAFLTAYLPVDMQKYNSSIYSIKYKKRVMRLLIELTPQNIWRNLHTFSSFKDRYADSESGIAAAKWIQTLVEAMAQTYGRKDITVSTISTDDWPQNSVIVKIGRSNEAGIVIGAHLDGVESKNGLPMPAADDNGSGSVTILEALRTILASGITFKKPIYFIWYAAEEEGLKGSQSVVNKFQEKNIRVAAVLNFDLTGYEHGKQSTIWLINDNVNKELTNYLETLIKTYVKKPVSRTLCGYACSDHYSWTQQGFIAAMPAESAYKDTNQNIHSERDTLNNLSLTHMTDYAKLAIAFAVELGEPKYSVK